MNIISGGLAANRRLLEDVRDIVQGCVIDFPISGGTT